MSAVASCWHRHLGHQRAGGLCVIARQQPVTTASQNKLHMWQLIDTPIDCPGTHLTCVGCTAPPAPLRTRHTGSSGGSARQVPQTGHCWTCHLLSPSQKLLVTNDCCRASTYTLRLQDGVYTDVQCNHCQTQQCCCTREGIIRQTVPPGKKDAAADNSDRWGRIIQGG